MAATGLRVWGNAGMELISKSKIILRENDIFCTQLYSDLEFVEIKLWRYVKSIPA